LRRDSTKHDPLQTGPTRLGSRNKDRKLVPYEGGPSVIIMDLAQIVENAELEGVLEKKRHTRMCTFDVKVDGWEDYGIVPFSGAAGVIGDAKAELLSNVEFEEHELAQLRFVFNPDYCSRRGITGTFTKKSLGRAWISTSMEMQENFQQKSVSKAIVG
jgi:hypothetical protein